MEGIIISEIITYGYLQEILPGALSHLYYSPLMYSVRSQSTFLIDEMTGSTLLVSVYFQFPTLPTLTGF